MKQNLIQISNQKDPNLTQYNQTHSKMPRKKASTHGENYRRKIKGRGKQKRT